jgi:hypothetical protein
MTWQLHQRTADILLRRQPLLLARLCAPQRPPWQPRHHSTTTTNSAPAAAAEPTPTEHVASGGFHEFGLHPRTVQALRSHFAIHQPSPIQSLVRFAQLFILFNFFSFLFFILFFGIIIYFLWHAKIPICFWSCSGAAGSDDGRRCGAGRGDREREDAGLLAAGDARPHAAASAEVRHNGTD